MKSKDYSTVKIKIQELLRLQFPAFEISEKSTMHGIKFFCELFLTNEVVKKIKAISRSPKQC
jgi:hypothetical protein